MGEGRSSEVKKNCQVWKYFTIHLKNVSCRDIVSLCQPSICVFCEILRPHPERYSFNLRNLCGLV